MKVKVTCVGGPIDRTVVEAEEICGRPCEVYKCVIGISKVRLEEYILYSVVTKDNEGEVNEIEVHHFLYVHESISCLPIALAMVIWAYSERTKQ